MTTLTRLVLLPALLATSLHTLAQPVLKLGPDSPQWELEGNAKVTEYLGRRCLMLNGAAAAIKAFELGDGVIDVDVATPARRGFFGIQFRLDGEGANGEWIYLRQHKSGLPDAMQYTPILGGGLNWQLYSGKGFTGAVDVPQNEWFHLRLAIKGAQANLFVKDMSQPALVMGDLKSGLAAGQVALASLTGDVCFSNFEVRSTPAAPWQRHWLAMPQGTLTKWRISPSLDALARNLEQPMSAKELNETKWQDVEAEAPGIVALQRYREAPHPRVSFANDPSKRLEPQKGMRVIYAQTQIESDRKQTKKLYLGYSDDVSVFLNGRILYRGRSAQYFRDPGFLGIMDAENDAIYLPLDAGSNELVLAVSELGGGWGFIARLADMDP
ncbi:hypothetical protein [Caenimonas koreensis]|uniref:hypothetical protein n=1 Tax=Caenimonas koreensis TaxID=367474 RepID=UPI0037841FA8